MILRDSKGKAMKRNIQKGQKSEEEDYAHDRCTAGDSAADMMRCALMQKGKEK